MISGDRAYLNLSDPRLFPAPNPLFNTQLFRVQCRGAVSLVYVQTINAVGVEYAGDGGIDPADRAVQETFLVRKPRPIRKNPCRLEALVNKIAIIQAVTHNQLIPLDKNSTWVIKGIS